MRVKNRIDIFEDNNIKYEIVPFEENNIEKQGYEKLPQIVFERISFALQNAPGQIAVKTTEVAANKAADTIAKNAFHLVEKNGMHLAKSRTVNGAYKGLWFLDDGNGLATQADWIPISLNENIVSRTPQLALGVFNVMSMATGQYFLSQINGKLDSIQSGLSDVMEYLETEKRSQIIANDMTLMNIYKNLDYIFDNNLEKQTTALELKSIRNASQSNIVLLRSKIESTKNELNISEKVKNKDLMKIFAKLEKDLPQYWCAVRSYINATVLETILTEMDNPGYLDNIEMDVVEKVNAYTLTCDAVDRQIQLFIEEAKDLNKTHKLPKNIINMVNAIPQDNLIGRGMKLFVLSANVADSINVKVSKDKKAKTKALADKYWSACRNLSSLDESVNLIDVYRENRNRPIELLCSNEAAYVKFGEKEKEKNQ